MQKQSISVKTQKAGIQHTFLTMAKIKQAYNAHNWSKTFQIFAAIHKSMFKIWQESYTFQKWAQIWVLTGFHRILTYYMFKFCNEDLFSNLSHNLNAYQNHTVNAFSICSFILIEAELSILGELSIISCSTLSPKEVDWREVKVLLFKFRKLIKHNVTT